MSRYQPSLRELAMEPDEDKRLEMAEVGEEVRREPIRSADEIWD